VSQSADNRRYEARQREKGYVRGPRITGDAAERLRTLAFIHGLTPCEVVSRLLLGESLGTASLSVVENLHGFSEAEARDFARLSEGWRA